MEKCRRGIYYHYDHIILKNLYDREKTFSGFLLFFHGPRFIGSLDNQFTDSIQLVSMLVLLDLGGRGVWDLTI